MDLFDKLDRLAGWLITACAALGFVAVGFWIGKESCDGCCAELERLQAERVLVAEIAGAAESLGSIAYQHATICRIALDAVEGGTCVAEQ